MDTTTQGVGQGRVVVVNDNPASDICFFTDGPTWEFRRFLDESKRLEPDGESFLNQTTNHRRLLALGDEPIESIAAFNGETPMWVYFR